MSAGAGPQLFSQRLAVVTALTDGDLVPMRNTSDAMYAIASDHTKWVKKYLSANDLLAECLGTLLAMDLDVPTAAGGYHVDASAMRWWLSRVIEPAFHWSPQRAQRLAEPKELGAILALSSSPRALAGIPLQAVRLSRRAIISNGWPVRRRATSVVASASVRRESARELTEPYTSAIPVSHIPTARLRWRRAVQHLADDVRAAERLGNDVREERQIEGRGR